MFQELSDWLSQTYLSSVLSDTTHMGTWLIIPISQSFHILAVGTVMICVGMLNLRLLRIAGTKRSFADLTQRLMPWIWSALAVLLITGVLQTIAEPSRELLNLTFRVKMVMLLAVVVISTVYEVSTRKEPRYWELSPDRQRVGNVLAVLSLVLWFGILAAGRLIAYVDLGGAF
jgi:uncharacterized membrane protein